MGIYLFKTEVLCNLLETRNDDDFGGISGITLFRPDDLI